ncbi:MAG: FAD binding domain-containing protein, partial [Thermodesulfobacteriota bacterium]|nr:FAD binding domain-containing protein [Thermodesulfobacteriota bacterium]
MIRLHKLDYTAPTTVNEACSILDKHGVDARVLAGGTDLLPACKLRNTRPALLVSLNKIQGLKGIRVHDGGGLKIGAMTSLYEVRHDSSIIKHHGALAQAASCVGAMQHQHMGTLGGNLCLNTRCIYYNQSDTWRKSREVCFKMGGDVCHVVPKGRKCYAVFSGDTAPALIALDARVILMNGSGERIMPAGELYTGDGMEPNALKHNEILSEIRLPPPVGRQSSLYLKYRQREAIDLPQPLRAGSQW